MSDVLTLIDRQLQYKQEAAERYTGRARLAIKTDIETLKRAREEIRRLEGLVAWWKINFLDIRRSVGILKDTWDTDSYVMQALIDRVSYDVEKESFTTIKEYEPKRPS